MRRNSKSPNVAHAWANQTKESAKNSNFYFEGDTIYSFGRHFPIAKHVTVKGVKKVLFTKKTYSVTTASHIAMVRSAASHLDKIYCYEISSYDFKNDSYVHEENFKAWERDIKENIKLLERARKPEKYIHEISILVNEVNQYVDFFGLKLTKAQKLIFTVNELGDYKNLLEKERKAKEARERAIIKTGSKLYTESLNQWHNYNETEYRKGLTSKQKDLLKAYMSLQDNNTTLLRTDGVNVETSKGVNMPVNVAKRYFNWFTGISAKGCVDCNYKMLDYPVTRADVNGLVVGCHNISIEEINNLKSKLNW